MSGLFIARVSVWRTLLLVAFGLTFTAWGLWAALWPDAVAASQSNPRDPAEIALFGWIAALFFGLCTVASVRELLRTEPQMVIGPEGLYWRRWSRATIPWSEFRRAERSQVYGTKFLWLWLHNPQAWRSTKLRGRLSRANKLIGGGEIDLSTVGLDRSFDEMVDAVAVHAPHLFER